MTLRRSDVKTGDRIAVVGMVNSLGVNRRCPNSILRVDDGKGIAHHEKTPKTISMYARKDVKNRHKLRRLPECLLADA